MKSVEQDADSINISLSDLKLRGATWNIYILNFILFFILKIWFRPWVIEQQGFDFLKLIAFSFPNYAEAYLGTFTLTTFLIIGRLKSYTWLKNQSDRMIYSIATALAAIYVITQEMKFHNLGGENVYDFNDVIASIIGLIVIFVMLNVFGLKLIRN
jgi:hypothetical protein